MPPLAESQQSKRGYSRARQRHDDGQCARTEYPCSDIGLEPTPPEVIAALRAEIAAFDASVTETGNG